MGSRASYRCAASVLLFCAASAVAQTRSPTPREQHPGITTTYETLSLRDGVKLQTIITKPAAATGRIPAILFVHWLSCDTVAVSSNPRDGWSAMMRRVVRESNALVWRTEKRGVGSSEGDCASMDYDTELADHREALAQLRRRPDVDPNRIVIFGGSIGGTYAPLLAAADAKVAGVLVWGAGATTWIERMLKFERNALELGGATPALLSKEMSARVRFLDRYLIEVRTPAQIAAEDQALGQVWTRMVGTSVDGHYGRPFAFHQQAQKADWAAAWSSVHAPVLVLYGQFDWFESRDAASLIARIVNSSSPGRAEFAEIPSMNHHFTLYPTAEAAFKEEGGRANPDSAVDPMLRWLAKVFSAN